MEVITLALFEMGSRKRERKQARIMIMLYVCTNKNETTPTMRRHRGAWKSYFYPLLWHPYFLACLFPG